MAVKFLGKRYGIHDVGGQKYSMQKYVNMYIKGKAWIDLMKAADADFNGVLDYADFQEVIMLAQQKAE